MFDLRISVKNSSSPVEEGDRSLTHPPSRVSGINIAVQPNEAPSAHTVGSTVAAAPDPACRSLMSTVGSGDEVGPAAFVAGASMCSRSVASDDRCSRNRRVVLRRSSYSSEYAKNTGFFSSDGDSLRLSSVVQRRTSVALRRPESIVARGLQQNRSLYFWRVLVRSPCLGPNA